MSWCIRPCTLADMEAMHAYYPGWTSQFVDPKGFNLELAWAAELDGAVVAVGGIERLWPGVGQAWLLLASDHVVGCVQRLVRGIWRTMGEAIHAYRLHRIEANVASTHWQGCTFVERLGFTREGTRRLFGPDRSDYHLYAWTKGD